MRLSVCLPMVFRDVSFAQAVQKAAALGFDAVETWKYAQLDLQEAAAVCRDSGVELLAICTSDFNMTQAGGREHWLENLRVSCEAAQKLGAEKVITQVGMDTGEPRAVQHDRIVDTMGAAIPILENSGLTLIAEPLNTVTRPGYYLSSSREAFAIIRQVNHPRVRLLYDIYHQQMMGEDVLPWIRENAELIGHLHVAGCPGRNEPLEERYPQILTAAEKAGYTGACGLEYKPLLPREESLTQVKKHLSEI